jgi:hypothetical protein
MDKHLMVCVFIQFIRFIKGNGLPSVDQFFNNNKPFTRKVLIPGRFEIYAEFIAQVCPQMLIHGPP